ncbi:hypothetical protein BJ165DRAFT_1524995 [Panaeolus papilionaceus]|nr:hypothetical protein BJ165DRAFT_1524995 [Panaeolus papilionaceus]
MDPPRPHTRTRDVASGSTSSLAHPNLQISVQPMIKRPIGLPPLSQYPVVLHPLLQHHHLPSIVFDLNQPLTCLALHAHVLQRAPLQHEGWLGDPATFPSDICSLTIRIAGVARPVVIVAATKAQSGLSSTSFITVWDVLCGCHRAWRQAKVEIQRMALEAHQSLAPQNRADPPGHPLLLSSSRDDDHGYLGSATQMNTGVRTEFVAMADCYFRNSSLWDGLIRSEETDVWILRPSPRVGWR